MSCPFSENNARRAKEIITSLIDFIGTKVKRNVLDLISQSTFNAMLTNMGFVCFRVA
jgi:hypothetical protein